MINTLIETVYHYTISTSMLNLKLFYKYMNMNIGNSHKGQKGLAM